MAMNAAALKDGEPNSEINTTPLIDVMLVLLIMLIVTIPPQRQAVSLDTPRQSNEAPAVQPPDPIRIAIDFDGAVSWNGASVDRNELERRLLIEAHRPTQPEIHIEPHRLAEYKYVAAVMASAQRLGIQKMGVVGGTT
ncbi:MAG: biopolymer transporter ExbD [Alphaproteobacteria bacterium]